LNDFEGLQELVEMVPENSPLLTVIGERFEMYGICEFAVQA